MTVTGNDGMGEGRGMHYVLSDIHGNGAAFDAMLARIDMRPDDCLFILGDVVDRGPDGVELLRRVMNMRNTTLLLGNHEHMMIDALRHPDDDFALLRWWKNGCEPTFRRFHALDEGSREALLRYLESLPVQLETRVNGRDYCLVHAAPVELYEPGWWKDEREFAVWHRMPLTLPSQLQGRTVLIGHTPTVFVQQADWPRPRIAHGDGVIDLDCGCAFPNAGGQLGCLRLEDMTEYYSEEGVVTAREAALWKEIACRAER